MDTGAALVRISVIIALFAYLETIRCDLRGEIKEVRQVSETAHKDILMQLSDIKSQQAAHTERFNRIEKHLNITHQEELK